MLCVSQVAPGPRCRTPLLRAQPFCLGTTTVSSQTALERVDLLSGDQRGSKQGCEPWLSCPLLPLPQVNSERSTYPRTMWHGKHQDGGVLPVAFRHARGALTRGFPLYAHREGRATPSPSHLTPTDCRAPRRAASLPLAAAIEKREEGWERKMQGGLLELPEAGGGGGKWGVGA